MVTLDLRTPRYDIVVPLIDSAVSFLFTTLCTYSTQVVWLEIGVSTSLTAKVELPLITLPSIVVLAHALLAPASRTNRSTLIGSMRTGSASFRLIADSRVNEIMSGRGLRTDAFTRTRSDLFTTICEIAGMATRKLIGVSDSNSVAMEGHATYKTGKKMARKIIVTNKCRHQNRFQWR